MNHLDKRHENEMEKKKKTKPKQELLGAEESKGEKKASG